jgi:plastocyanin
VTSVQVPGGVQSFDSTNMNKGDIFKVTLTIPGTYLYHCTYHSWMKGTIIVKAQ